LVKPAVIDWQFPKQHLQQFRLAGSKPTLGQRVDHVVEAFVDRLAQSLSEASHRGVRWQHRLGVAAGSLGSLGR
jgi:hypothetical protein